MRVMTFEEKLRSIADEVNAYLDHQLPKANGSEHDILYESMRYSVFAGGKRIRPAITILTSELFDVPKDISIAVGSTFELIHTYSLIHDDLPAMDDDDYRRGKPSNHKKFNEAIAILTGDALLTLAFEWLSHLPYLVEAPDIGMKIISTLSRLAGHSGLIAGQMIDMESQTRTHSADLLHKIHEGKTVSLIQSAILSGAILGRATHQELDLLKRFSHNLGLIFQAVDDILDVTSTTETLGKTVGKDEAQDKLTYPKVYGIENAKKEVERLKVDALKVLTNFKNTFFLEELVHFLVRRTS